MLHDFLRRVYARINPRSGFPSDSENYFGTPILGGQQGQDQISHLIQSGNPSMVARFGHAELRALVSYLDIKEYRSSSALKQYVQYIRGHATMWTDDVKLGISRNAGFFPATEEYLEKFGECYLDAIKDIDVLATWQLQKEDVVFHDYFPTASLIKLECLEPYFFAEPWTQFLAGKKVLIVHPFVKSIENQYRQHELLFQNKIILPAFELQTVKAVVSNAYSTTQFGNWFQALQSMQEQIAEKNFDVAIIGAGAYGLPLASFVKRLGKQAVHMGGSLQILFGIKGARWDNNPRVASLYNDYWVRPLPEETPQNFQSVEDGCYW